MNVTFPLNVVFPDIETTNEEIKKLENEYMTHRDNRIDLGRIKERWQVLQDTKEKVDQEAEKSTLQQLLEREKEIRCFAEHIRKRIDHYGAIVFSNGNISAFECVKIDMRPSAQTFLQDPAKIAPLQTITEQFEQQIKANSELATTYKTTFVALEQLKKLSDLFEKTCGLNHTLPKRIKDAQRELDALLVQNESTAAGWTSSLGRRVFGYTPNVNALIEQVRKAAEEAKTEDASSTNEAARVSPTPQQSTYAAKAAGKPPAPSQPHPNKAKKTDLG